MKLFKKRGASLLTLALFVALSLVLTRGLKLDPHLVPSALINKKIPEFTLPDLQDPNHFISQRQWLGKPALINVWASWCASCEADHAILMKIVNEFKVTVYGLNYKDNATDARKWLEEYGNPYSSIVMDSQGKTAIDLGVYGTPETFVIDSEGIIKYKHIGAMTPEIWQSKIEPLLSELKGKS